MQGNKPSRKKKTYPIQKELEIYLDAYNRKIPLPLQYEDLLRFTTAIPLLDANENDTFWQTVYYSEQDTQDLYAGMTKFMLC